MFTRRVIGCLLFLALLAAGFAAKASATSVTLTVEDPSNVARINDPVTSGVPISIGDTASSVQWKLVDNSTSLEIPVQTKVLFGVHNPWLLVDFKASVSAGATKTYTLSSQTPTVSASPALNIDDTSPSSITVITGPLKVVIGKNPFNLFDGVWLDRDGDHVFNNGGPNPKEKLVAPTTNDNLPLVVATPGVNRVGRRVPMTWSWEDRGPLRATLRVDGYYGDPAISSDTLLYYTTRMTFHAGQTYVTVDHLIRNSFHSSERYVKVRSAKLLVGSGPNPATGRVKRSGDRVWMYPSSGKASFEMIPDTLEYTASYNTQTFVRTNAKINVDANGGMIVADWSYNGARARFDFSDTTLSGGEQTNRKTRYLDRLVARAPATWYSDRGAFASENFGTWDDEKTANTQWGWQWPNTTPTPLPGVNFGCYAAEHALPRPAFSYYPSWSILSGTGDLESDDVWMHLMMYARVGHRTYLDRAERWARYAAWEYAYRTDGFAHQDQGFCDTLVRARNDLPVGVVFSPPDTAYIYYNTKFVQNIFSGGRNDGNHTWNGGLVDYYYLTGDRDALTAALDIAEQTKKYQECVPIDSLGGGASLRFYARSYINLLRAWEATGSSYWRLSANRLKAMFFRSSYYDPRGCYYAPTSLLPGTIPDRFPGGRYVSPFQMGIASQALYRDWVLTPAGLTRDSLEQRLVALADFAFDFGANPDSGFTGDDMVLDYPDSNDVLHIGYNMLRFGTMPWNSIPASSNSFVDALTIGYRLTGNPCYMSKAREMWEHASKDVRWSDNVIYRIADENHLGRFANTLQCGDGLGYPNAGDLTTVQFYFHDEAQASFDYVAPAEVSDVSTLMDYFGGVITWTAPGDDGTTGQAAAYDLRYSTSPITLVNFRDATQAPAPQPGQAGSVACSEVTLPSCTTFYFALRTVDECGNWSGLSNIATGSTDCQQGTQVYVCGSPQLSPRPATPEAELPQSVEFSIAGSNPVSGPSTVAFGIPASKAGQKLEISLFDLAGRHVRTIHSAPARAGRFRVQWNTNDGATSPLRSGAYFLAMRLGEELRSKKLILVQ